MRRWLLSGVLLAQLGTADVECDPGYSHYEWDLRWAFTVIVDATWVHTYRFPSEARCREARMVAADVGSRTGGVHVSDCALP